MLVITLISCKGNTVFTIENANFETGDFSGWILEGDSFNVTDQTSVNGKRYNNVGTFHLVSSEEKTGSLQSKDFTLGGLGYITIMIGSGRSFDDTYVGLYSKDGELLETLVNTAFDFETFTDNYVRYIWDVSGYVGQEVYIKIVDNSVSSNYGNINVDDIDVLIETEKELHSYQMDALLRLGVQTDDLIASANYYIDTNSLQIEDQNKYTYHVTGEIGWINDPNGFSMFNDEYHLFYQHNPYQITWGPMHWGHVVSTDLVKWEYLPIAVAPHEYHAEGGAAFSGSALEIDGKLYLMYTENWPRRQVQVIRESVDGINFDLISEDPVIDASQLPSNVNPVDFRDPKIFINDGLYYSVIGSRQSNSFGQVLLYKSSDLLNWEYVGAVIQGSSSTVSKLGYMLECPDIFTLNDKDILIMSPQQIPNHRNHNGTVYVVGDMNYTTGLLENVNYEDIQEIDYGFDFYAPQTMIDKQGRRIMVAWMQTWNRTPVTSEFGYAGAMTFPRELTLNDEGKLIQYPVSELELYRNNHQNTSVSVEGYQTINNMNGNTIDIDLSFTPKAGKSGITLFANDNGEGTKVYYENGYIVLDRTLSSNGRIPSGEINNITRVPVDLNDDDSIELRILLDRFSIEVFVNEGEKAITATVFPNIDDINIVLFSDEETTFILDKWDIIVD